ncbi:MULTISPECIES: amino acid ABC transporter permease [Actinomycetes]|jgi:glutamate transport system permease protein|uniref:Amino acid ABC transporter permease n=1 Tax=Williamsia marianensis TaxID=85044 RepID=A0A315SDA7_WILMA|nr:MULTISPECIES: amino acid ABC transporter permease [Actinomycetes]MCK0518529.1 amino acid ABC transporter permease [Williamsia sp. DF01-3]MDV7135584.1 amino acid ABC transporter permease [Williamsia muralis]PVY32813.1 glutamate transport system permease protein [Williamsia marianensis]RKR95745.1 glutamate transport system permease protein [Williamsia muralis]
MSELWSDIGPQLWPAYWVTLKLTFYSAIGSLIWGTVLAGMRVSPVPVMRVFGTWYVNIVRNTPLTLIVIFASVGLYQNLGLKLAQENDEFITNNNFWLAVLAFVLYTSTFVCETLRSGFNTVPLGQAEAARSLGLPFSKVFGIIVLPQAVRSVIGPMGSVLIALTKNTTIASAIGVAEASLLMKEQIENHADQVVGIFVIIAIGFMVITLTEGYVFGFLAKRLAVKR